MSKAEPVNIWDPSIPDRFTCDLRDISAVRGVSRSNTSLPPDFPPPDIDNFLGRFWYASTVRKALKDHPLRAERDPTLRSVTSVARELRVNPERVRDWIRGVQDKGGERYEIPPQFIPDVFRSGRAVLIPDVEVRKYWRMDLWIDDERKGKKKCRRDF